MIKAELEKWLLRVVKENGDFDPMQMELLLGQINVDKKHDMRLVSRFEVIDHRTNGLGRVYSCRPCSASISFQDEGKTLKVFLTDAKPGVNWQG